MNADDPRNPADPPEPARPSLDPSEEEALLQHLRRYTADTRRRRPGRTRLVAGAVVAGALVLLVAGIARWPRPETPGLVPGPPVAVLAERDEPRTSPSGAPPLAREAPVPDVAPPEPRSAVDDVAPVTSGAIASVSSAPAPPRTPTTSGAVSYPPRERLATVSPGDPKERVFDLFAATFEARDGAVVRIDGMRWQARGRSPHHARVDVAEVVVGDGETPHLHWFVFGDGRLVAWGRPQEWSAAARRHAIETNYQPAAARPLRAP